MAIGKSIKFSGSPIYKIRISCSNVVCIHLFHVTVSHHGNEVMALLPKSMEKTPILAVFYSLSGIHKPIIIMISVLSLSIRLQGLPSPLFIRKDLVVLYLPH